MVDSLTTESVSGEGQTRLRLIISVMIETSYTPAEQKHACEDNHKRIARIASYQCRRLLVAPVSVELHQKDKEVEEIKVKRKRAHDRLLAGNCGAVAVQINLLNALRVVGGQSDEHDDANHRNSQLHDRRCEKYIHDARDDDADQPHQ